MSEEIRKTAEAILAAPADVNDFDSTRAKFLDSLSISDLKALAKAYLDEITPPIDYDHPQYRRMKDDASFIPPALGVVESD